MEHWELKNDDDYGKSIAALSVRTTETQILNYIDDRARCLLLVEIMGCHQVLINPSSNINGKTQASKAIAWLNIILVIPDANTEKGNFVTKHQSFYVVDF